MNSIKCVFPSKKPLCLEALAHKIMRKVPTSYQSPNVSSDLCCIHPKFLFILKGVKDWQKYVACARAFYGLI